MSPASAVNIVSEQGSGEPTQSAPEPEPPPVDEPAPHDTGTAGAVQSAVVAPVITSTQLSENPISVSGQARDTANINPFPHDP
ncbi:MAG: hypothetical protein ABIR57_10320, partial [Aeromicrobium sp.]